LLESYEEHHVADVLVAELCRRGRVWRTRPLCTGSLRESARQASDSFALFAQVECGGSQADVS